jgi:CheY-like chemotaxis protein
MGWDIALKWLRVVWKPYGSVAERFDLIFMDIMMPEMDGLDAVRGIREIYKRNGWKEALIVMVTACEDKVLDARDAGAVGYLLKPVRQCQVLDWIGYNWRCLKGRMGKTWVNRET